MDKLFLTAELRGTIRKVAILGCTVICAASILGLASPQISSAFFPRPPGFPGFPTPPVTPPATPPTTPPVTPPVVPPVIPPAAAFSPTPYSSIYAPSGVCQLASGTANIPNAQLSAYNAGAGVDIAGVGKVYRANTLYHCCYEQYLGGNEPAVCANVYRDQRAGNVDAWTATIRGDLYTRFGMPNTRTPATGNFQTPANANKIAEYTFSSKQSVPAGRRTGLSGNNYLLLGYDNSSTRPPVVSGFDSWYDYVRRLIQINSTITTRAITTISGGFAGALSTNAAGGVFQVNGNLRVTSGASCDTRALILVDGELTLDPQIRIANINSQTQGCLFVAKGKVTISQSGTAATRLTNGPVFYDEIQLGIITQNEVFAPYDGTDGLKITGVVTAGGGNFQRAVNNPDYPALWMEYDPRYIELFKNELKLLRFSTREKGFIDPI